MASTEMSVNTERKSHGRERLRDGSVRRTHVEALDHSRRRRRRRQHPGPAESLDVDWESTDRASFSHPPKSSLLRFFGFFSGHPF